MSRRKDCRPLVLVVLIALAYAAPAAPLGYYRQPTIYKDQIVFVAEGDLWRVTTAGGAAVRLTSHPADESTPAISPDGQTVAFVGHYEGVYGVVGHFCGVSCVLDRTIPAGRE